MSALPILSTPIYRRYWFSHAAFAAVLSVAFLALLWIVRRSAPTEFDRALAREIQAIDWGAFVFFPRLGSEIGGGPIGFYVAPIVLATIFAFRRAWRLLALLAAVFLLHFVLISPKLFIEAYRPSPAFGVEGGGGQASFPSGHVQWTVSFWGFVAFVLWRISPVRFRPIVVTLYVLLTVAAMLGRIELGKHWPVDTLAGLLAGLIALSVVVALHDAPSPRLATGDVR